MLDRREEKDTTGRALKAIGLLPIMARLAVQGLPITRPVLAQNLGVAENTLVPLTHFLAGRNLIEIEERRIPGQIGFEFAITLPDAIVARMDCAIRRLEKEADNHDWPESQQDGLVFV